MIFFEAGKANGRLCMEQDIDAPGREPSYHGRSNQVSVLGPAGERQKSAPLQVWLRENARSVPAF